MGERLRNLVDVPEKIVITAGALGLFISLVYPPALIPSLLAIIGGSVSMGITNGVWPKKPKTT